VTGQQELRRALLIPQLQTLLDAFKAIRQAGEQLIEMVVLALEIDDIVAQDVDERLDLFEVEVHGLGAVVNAAQVLKRDIAGRLLSHRTNISVD
jgi:sugar phosphate isomerase/epimerase